MAYSANIEEGMGLVYDLRQRYAKLVGDHLEIIARYRIDHDLPAYWDSLEDLYCVVAHKLKDKSINNNEQNKKILIYTWEELQKKLFELSNLYKSVWIGEDKVNVQGYAELTYHLRLCERWLYAKMDEAGMFGTSYKYDEDEI